MEIIIVILDFFMKIWYNTKEYQKHERMNNYMKRWQIIVIACICIIGAIVGGGKLIYEIYLVPKYIEPVANKMEEYINDSDVIDRLYRSAERLYEEGYIEDDTYTAFIRKYSKREIQNTEVAKEIMAEASKEESDSSKSNDNSSVTARYASKRVGVEMIQVIEDDEQAGSSQTRYSTERTSDRVKSEDIVEAERVLNKDNKQEDEDDLEQNMDTKTAYQKLKDNMTADEFATFTSIMRNMDINTLLSLADNKEGLKEYMHSRLSDEQYKSIVNLGYKYAYVFLED